MNDDLKRFLLLAQNGNVTRTAEEIFITQSALTQSIHRLENELQTKLFLQKGKQLMLTDNGKSLIIIGEKIHRLWNNAQDAQLKKLQIPNFTIGMFDNIALRMGKFFQTNMQTEKYKLDLTIDSSGKLLTQLQLGTIDAALCVFNETYHIPPHISLLQTYSEKLIPVSAKSFSEPLKNIPFILYNRGSNTRMQIDELFIQYGMQPTIYAESTSVTFMRELALLGSGVALLPENFVNQDLKEGRLKKIKMPMQWKRIYGLFLQKQISPMTDFVLDLQNALKRFTKI
jgi:DNA-binding transcriptional LysR family regulator